MGVFQNKKFRSTASASTLGARYRLLLAKHPFALFGLPFIGTIVAGSFFLTPATALRYEKHDRKVKRLSEDEALGLGKGRRKVDLNEEYYVSYGRGRARARGLMLRRGWLPRISTAGSRSGSSVSRGITMGSCDRVLLLLCLEENAADCILYSPHHPMHRRSLCSSTRPATPTTPDTHLQLPSYKPTKRKEKTDQAKYAQTQRSRPTPEMQKGVSSLFDANPKDWLGIVSSDMPGERKGRIFGPK